VAEKIVRAGIPVMGHVGLTPQTAEQLGGFKVQGKDAESARKIIANAKGLEDKGCFSIVLECIPVQIAEIITQQLSIPTIGIGAGQYCDGQVLVTHDLLGLFDRFKPKFVKQYTDVSVPILEGLKKFCREVEEGKFPDVLHSYSIKPEELTNLKVKP
jgi:3-methyl-2-oxobutanoate hydroxymethyltransferase